MPFWEAVTSRRSTEQLCWNIHKQSFQASNYFDKKTMAQGSDVNLAKIFGTFFLNNTWEFSCEYFMFLLVTLNR